MKKEGSAPKLAPKDWGVADPEGYTAFELLQVFKNNSEDGLLTHEGMYWMTNIFDKVPLESRASVFVQFLGLLNEEGIEYDKLQFNDETVADDLPPLDA
jgi:hypothetical protein